MKDFTRNKSYFSLCGLNCKLCSMNLSGHCGGCGFGNQSCPIARCSLEHGNQEYCFQCSEYPCERYAHIDEADSFITHMNQKTDTYIGFPTNSGVGSYMNINSGYGMSANCADKEAAWQFLRSFMTEKAAENGDYYWGFPANRNQLEKRLKEKSSVELKLRKKK